MSNFPTITHKAQLCVIGGGLAGTICAISAARRGVKVVLVQDRPVLGGNCSSEIRMWVRGAKGSDNRETGILAELEEENIYRNPTLSATVFDSVLFGKVKAEKNITLLLNTSCLDAESSDERIKSITAWQLTTYTYHKIEAELFADCSGDGVLSFLTKAEHRMGREAKSEYGETIGPDVSDTKTMGMSMLLQARETDHKVSFIPPEWANVYETDDDFAQVPYLKGEHSTFRDHKIGTSGCNLWWMELGGDGEMIRNTEECRDELIKIVFGIWDHIKNRGDHGCDNWELEWVGFLPGKRESVRYIGDYVLTQNDIEQNRDFDDAVAYGGWPMDDHNPKGFYANSADDEPSIMYPAPSPYQIPYRCLYSKNIENLFFAGRDISATHAAMSSTRVMGTCSLLGQAIGCAAALAVKHGTTPRGVYKEHIRELQKEILDGGIMIPKRARNIPKLTQEAKMNISEHERAILQNGIERPHGEDVNNILLDIGSKLVFDFGESKDIDTLRIQLDLDYSRKSLTPNMKMQWFAQKLNVGKDFVPMKVAATIVKSFEVFADGVSVYKNCCNYNSLVLVPLKLKAKNITVSFYETWGADKVSLYACDITEEN